MTTAHPAPAPPPLQFLHSSSTSSSKHSGEPGHDDLLFFVSHPAATKPREDAYFVRRKGKRLPDDLQLSGSAFASVDWCQTVLLNIVLQSHYSLTVVTCGWVRVALPAPSQPPRARNRCRSWRPHSSGLRHPNPTARGARPQAGGAALCGGGPDVDAQHGHRDQASVRLPHGNRREPG
jgi:hypothetical protein